MKRTLITLQFAFATLLLSAQSTYEFRVVSSIESIIPMGLGRSRMLMSDTEVDIAQFTTERKDGTDSDMGKVKRKDLKIDEMEETKMLNFYSGIGINFQNVASNDVMIASMLTKMSAEGWELFNVVGGVESDAGKDDGNGLFITRYIFRRAVR